jgi:sec-independent protein translocase protein TatC
MARIPTTLPNSQRKVNPEGRMPLMDHIRELRNRIVKAAVAGLLGMVVGVVFFDRIYDFITAPYCRAVSGCDIHNIGKTLIITGPLDGFYLRIKLAFIIGLVISSPIWLYQLWGFVAPGLYAKEKKYTYTFVGAAVPLFGLGFFFAVLMMGRGLHYLIELAPPNSTNLFTADTYLGYFLAMILGFGLCFELPLMLVMLNLIGVLPHSRFRKWRRVLIFLVFVFAGIASPSPDPITMLLLGLMCLVLVEAAEAIVYLNDRRRGRLTPFEGLTEEQFAELQRTDLPVDE